MDVGKGREQERKLRLQVICYIVYVASTKSRRFTTAWMQEVGRKPLPAFSAFATSLWFSNAGAVAEAKLALLPTVVA